METELINIKSIDIQIKDIKQMIYSKSMRMLSLYTKYRRKNKYNDEDFITLSKVKKGSKKESINKELIYDIITSTWLIDGDEIENKSKEELEKELLDIENEIGKLKIKLLKTAFSKYDITNRINLLTYKKSCINDYLSQKYNENKTKKLTKK